MQEQIIGTKRTSWQVYDEAHKAAVITLGGGADIHGALAMTYIYDDSIIIFVCGENLNLVKMIITKNGGDLLKLVTRNSNYIGINDTDLIKYMNCLVSVESSGCCHELRPPNSEFIEYFSRHLKSNDRMQYQSLMEELKLAYENPNITITYFASIGGAGAKEFNDKNAKYTAAQPIPDTTGHFQLSTISQVLNSLLYTTRALQNVCKKSDIKLIRSIDFGGDCVANIGDLFKGLMYLSRDEYTLFTLILLCIFEGIKVEIFVAGLGVDAQIENDISIPPSIVKERCLNLGFNPMSEASVKELRDATKKHVGDLGPSRTPNLFLTATDDADNQVVWDRLIQGMRMRNAKYNPPMYSESELKAARSVYMMEITTHNVKGMFEKLFPGCNIDEIISLY